ncbi:MAG: hypothetical protein IJZ49_08680 [Alistipes sp.]|nr:hypothetical protein [Alistipes sp.]
MLNYNTMLTPNFIFVLLGLLLCSCGSKEIGEDPRFFAPDKFKIVNSAPDTTKVLKLEKLPIEVYGPQDICAVDSLLFVRTMGPDKLITIVNLNTNQAIIKIAPIGRGPNDFLECIMNNHFFYNDDGDLVMELSDELYLKNINVSKSIREQGTFLDSSIKLADIYENLQAEMFGYKLVFHCGEERYFIKHDISYQDAREGKFTPPLYIIKTSEGQKNINVYPEALNSQLAYASYTQIKPDGTKAVDVMGLFDYINIIDLKTGTVTAVGEQDGLRFADYQEAGQMTLERQRGIHSIGVSDKYIVTLGRGSVYYTANDGTRRKWPSIRVYDWSGNFVASAMLPQRIYPFQMAFDAENNLAYFFVRETEEFYRCDLSELLK